MEIHLIEHLPQWNWPSDKDLGIRFIKWQIDFENLHHRQPTVPELLEWAYQEGVRDGKGRRLEE